MMDFSTNKPEFLDKKDILDYIKNNGVQILNFRYVGGDGRLKTLSFVTNDLKHIDSVLSLGERIDGSSIFSNMPNGSSDLYIIPKYSSCFVNPFAEIPTLDVLCSFLDKDGNEPEDIPEVIMKKAHKSLNDRTGYTLHAMGELEYYVISEKDKFYNMPDQQGYHESSPFVKWQNLRDEAMGAIAQCGGMIKYGHSEVGNFVDENYYYEQNEIEFLPVKLEDAAFQLILAKWVLRMLGHKYGVTISFAPKIAVGVAGSGMHVHMRLMKDGDTATVENGQLSKSAIKSIAGILDLSKSLTAFGNTIPLSYYRLVANHEAPISICWGERNRSALIRVPLGWTGDVSSKILKINKNSTVPENYLNLRQTYEFRAPDGSADIFLLFAGLAVGTRFGLEMADALEIADSLHIGNSDDGKKEFGLLPSSNKESADALLLKKSVYLEDGVFPDSVITDIVHRLNSCIDIGLYAKPGDHELEFKKLVMSNIHCM